MSQPVQARDTRQGRMYVHPLTGEEFVSVTNVLGTLAKPALAPWSAKMAATFAVKNLDAWLQLPPAAAIDVIKRESTRYTGNAAEVGNAVHDVCERWAAGEREFADVERYEEDVRKFVVQFADFLTTWNPTYWATEATVYSREHGYAGTMDAGITLPGVGNVLLDYKTGKNVYAEAALQLAAYRHAECIVTGPPWVEEPMPETIGAAVLHLRPTKWALMPVDTDAEVFATFTHLARVAAFKRERMGTVVGLALAKPEHEARGAVDASPPRSAPATEAVPLVPAPVETTELAELVERIRVLHKSWANALAGDWMRAELPALGDAWTADQIELLEAMVAEAEQGEERHRVATLRVVERTCADVLGDVAYLPRVVTQATEGRAAALGECTLTELEAVERVVKSLERKPA